MLLASFKILNIFILTIKYYLLSYVRSDQILFYKKKWADDVLNLFGYKVVVQGNAPAKKNEALILVGNHISYLDIILLMSIYPEVVFLAKKEVGNWPIIGSAARRIGTLFVNREVKHDREHLRTELSRILLEKKAQLVVFPSGTTTLSEDINWKKGIFEIALNTQLKVKAFKIDYYPLRESAYINQDNLIVQMSQVLKIQNKVAHFNWLNEYIIQNPVADSENIRHSVMA